LILTYLKANHDEEDVVDVFGIYALGEEYVVDDLFRRFEGQASTMRVIVDFEFP